MTALRAVLIGSGRFLYRFVVGDDPAVAAVMLIGLAATGLLVSGGVNAWWLVPVLAVVMTATSLRRRRSRRA